MKTSITFSGYRQDKEWSHYSWIISINGETFEYKTGVGHATKRTKRDRQGYHLGLNKKPENSIVCQDTDAWAHIPNIDEVLHCLFSDAQCGAESFDDFCDNLGYSNDSLKALDVYRACMESGKKLRKALQGEYSKEFDRVQALNI